MDPIIIFENKKEKKEWVEENGLKMTIVISLTMQSIVECMNPKKGVDKA
jgi:hypothetical protein